MTTMTIDANHGTTPRAGELDPEFNGGNLLELQGVSANNVAIGPNNNIYIAGATKKILEEGDSGFDLDYCISVFTPDGTPGSFYNNSNIIQGAYASNFPSEAFRIFVSPDGKILTLGAVLIDRDSNKMQFGLSRHLPNGELDSSFGHKGHSVLSFKFDQLQLGLANRITTSKDGAPSYLKPTLDEISLCVHDSRIYIAGRAIRPNSALGLTLLMCLDESGNLAMDFGNGGAVVIESPAKIETVLAKLLVTNERLYLAGSLDGVPAWARLHLDGRLDTSFGSGGFLLGSVGPGVIYATAIHGNSKLLGAGYNVPDGPPGGMLTSIDKDGAKDTDFNNGEPILQPIEPDFRWRDCAIDQRGHIVACGETVHILDTGTKLVFGRYLPNGTLDLSFGNGGLSHFHKKWLLTNPAIAIQTDNAIVVVAISFADLNSPPVHIVFRLKG